jgi:hypothetical protein
MHLNNNNCIDNKGCDNKRIEVRKECKCREYPKKGLVFQVICFESSNATNEFYQNTRNNNQNDSIRYCWGIDDNPECSDYLHVNQFPWHLLYYFSDSVVSVANGIEFFPQ